jgi:hypothetical protein
MVTHLNRHHHVYAGWINMRAVSMEYIFLSFTFARLSLLRAGGIDRGPEAKRITCFGSRFCLCLPAGRSRRWDQVGLDYCNQVLSLYYLVGTNRVRLVSFERALQVVLLLPLHLDIDITTGTGELVLRVFNHSKVNGQQNNKNKRIV